MRMLWAVVVLVGVGCGGAGAVEEQDTSCEEGRCVSALCAPQTCEALGATCGTVDDGCGGVLDCGECACAPKSCEQLLKFCGPADDGCGGTIDCGPCACEVHEDLGSALPVQREGQSFSATGVDFGSGHYYPAYDAFLWSAPHTGSFVISGGQGGIAPRVTTGECNSEAAPPGPTAEHPERYDLQTGQQVWITFVGDYGTRWAAESNFYRLSITEAKPTEAGACGNGVNDDGDALFDCHDPDCSGDPACGPLACADLSVSPGVPLELEMLESPPLLDRFPQPCGQPRVRHPERIVLWTAPKAGEFAFHAGDARGYTISLWSQCGGSPLACASNPSGDADIFYTATIVRRLAAGESVLVVLEGTVEGNSWRGPPSRLMIHEVGPELGHCADGRDNDGDGFVDHRDEVDCPQ